MRYGRTLMCAAVYLLSPLAGLSAPVNYELVAVRDKGNSADASGYGAVTYDFSIGKYEVTIAQYAGFLNAVAASDTYGLYNNYMGTSLGVAGIARDGSSGSYTYSVIGPFGINPTGATSPGNRPITYVSWFDAARFANWMANGQPAGLQSILTTENGAYNLDGAVSGNAAARNAINPNTGAAPTFYIPTENEWYKSAYYKSGGMDAGYWTYATQSDTIPGNGNGWQSTWPYGTNGPALSMKDSPNQVNYPANSNFAVTQSSAWEAGQNYLTEVGAFSNSASAYGTFDQSGNVYEWNDLTGTSDSSRGRRGGDWVSVYFAATLSSSHRQLLGPALEDSALGFRLASTAVVPEPSTYAMALAGLACGGFSMWRRRRRA